MKCTRLIFGVMFSALLAGELLKVHAKLIKPKPTDAKQRKRPKKRCLDSDSDEDPPCKTQKREYKYYPLKNVCEKVTVPWCKGDGSMFKTMEKCVRKCVITEQCYMPPVTGPCRAYIPSYYYNHKTDRCEMFVYGGCGGNANRFATEQDCINACVDPCYRDKGTKPCTRRYTYDNSGDECMKGCGGGKNKFKSLEDCQNRCLAPTDCDQPPEKGPCRGYFLLYFYNTTSEECETFVYGGCGGNGNRFLTYGQCVNTCFEPKTCMYEGKAYPANVDFYPTACLTCKCTGSDTTPMCRTPGCATPACENPISLPDRCCRVCEKSGTCPNPPVSASCAIECSADSDCSGDKLCCFTGCRGRLCTIPVNLP